jgi:ApbE superfamily uncharacterized protein (UPF0280 family)
VSAAAALLPGNRLHLHHGPIDCICRADGDPASISRAYEQAIAVFEDLLGELCAELGSLRTKLPSPRPRGHVARAMHDAVAPFAGETFITPMAAVAGAVADHVLAAMLDGGRNLRLAFVNNGGDIAFHVAPGARFRTGLVTELAAPALDAFITLTRSGGIATSGRACKGQGGKSVSRGIADAVTVIAKTGAAADAAATIIANAVDLPGHPGVIRRPANSIDPDSDLGAMLITWQLGAISEADAEAALDAGRALSDRLARAGLIEGAVLALRGRMVMSGTVHPEPARRSLEAA